MQKRVVLVSAAVAVLGLAAAVLGFVSERAKSKAYLGYDGQRCVYRRTAAFACGLAAALLVVTAMAVATAASGCFGRYGDYRSAPGSSGRRPTAVKLSTIAWVLVVVATVLFLYGAYRNSGGTSGLSRFRGGRRFNRTYYYACADVRGGIFATASIASAVATACAVAAYINLHKQDEPGQYGGPGGGVAMGQPQWSQPSYPPPQGQFADPGSAAMGQPTQWAQPYPAAYPPPVGYPAPPPHHGYGDGYGGKPPAGST